MKVRINITISEEALRLADESGNRSQFIEDLIMNKGNPTDDWEVLPEYMTRTQVLELIRQEMGKVTITPSTNTFTPKPPDPELGYPCCQKKSPCKHWVWDGLEGLWKNTLTNKTREA